MSDKSLIDDEIEKLRAAIQIIDDFSQHGLAQIASIARLTLLSMKTPETCRTSEDIANVLEAICYKAEEVENFINVEAESCGCNYINNDQRQRSNAQREVNHDQ